ncbi:ABC transporter permease [Kribbella pittospori]|uniref:ABC transporter permease n=1 Tax=Kribbella pittospori TaxID=722689 RepID=A0A4R0KB87_9ACTN|nr:ABC transporter permease [Kribbella pittospori]TCC57039.1 ABC transporter permease [Kribbella pittospori]
MGGWSPPLRIARRTTRKSLGRTFLVAALIGLPVLAATWMGVIFKTSSPEGENLAKVTVGQADAQLTVTQYAKLTKQTSPPGLEMGEPPPAAGAEEPVRTPGKFDPLPLLPPGSTLARQFTDGGTVEIHGREAKTSVGLVTGDGKSPLTQGTVKVDHGRLPATKDEIAISPSLADRLGISGPTGTVTSGSGQSYTVVGIARRMSQQGAETIFATPDTSLGTPDPTISVNYLVKLPAGADPDMLVPQLIDHGMLLLPRANIVDPPPNPYGTSSTDIGPYAAMALIIGFGVLEIVLLAGTAFAVGARRQTRELGLVMATGGTPRDVRRIVLMQGLFAGLVGVVGGLVTATVLVLAGKPLWEKLTGAVFTAWQVPWLNVGLIALLGLVAGLAAAVVPARSASRQSPVSALAGRFAVSAKQARIRKPAVVLLVAGIACVFIGSALIAAALQEAQRAVSQDDPYQATVTPAGPIALVLLGITATIAALVWMLPSLVGKFSRLARALPLSARLAVRDAARHRHRTGPATAAIMMAVAGTAAVAFAGSNAIAAEAKNYTADAHYGDASIRFDTGGPDSAQYSSSTVDRVSALLPVRHQYELGTVSLPEAKANAYGYIPQLFAASGQTEGSTSYGLLAVDPAYIARFGEYGAKAAAELRAGKVVLPLSTLTPGQKTEVSAEGDSGQERILGSLVAAFAGNPPRVSYLQQSALISQDAARKLGKITVYQVHYELTREPTKDELGAVARFLGSDEMLQVERGYQSPARLFLLGILGAATVVTLLGVAISVSLSAAEGRADLATLAAIGAQPRRRRNLAAAQAWVLGQLGCVLGVGVGALYGYTAHAAFGSPHFMVPWVELGGIVIVVPLFAGLLAWLMTRSRLPMVSRID